MHSDRKEGEKLHGFLKSWVLMKLHTMANKAELQIFNHPEANYWKIVLWVKYFNTQKIYVYPMTYKAYKRTEIASVLSVVLST